MAYMTWLADALRKAGLKVNEVPGWRTRGHGSMSDIRGVLAHHTAGPASGNYPSLGTVQDGRPGLDGPLAQLGLARDGTWYVIAAGQSWHAGTGYVSWCGRDNGNAHLIGIEAESTGRGDWTRAQLDAYPRGVAALLKHLGLPASRAIGHKEWAPSRKVDPHGWPDDMAGFRSAVSKFISNPTPATPKEIDVQFTDTWDEEALNKLGPKKLGWALLNIKQNIAATRAIVTKQGAALTALAQLVANQSGGLTAEQVEAAVEKAIAESVIEVDVNVAGKTA